ncbi:DUF3310 domain-containing protein [Globicatella sanguinis]|uniref:DUF3310 domain-containing protein n=1 Tax=Globicatella sanguinis TaxID=13076 RepID=UPI001FDF3B48|nr:DUF3310 domain-containing protein [Globicatella sanguinis]
MSRELYPGYIVKAKGQKGKITAVNLHTVVVQLNDHKESFKREDIEVLEAVKDSDIKTYKIDEIQYCEDCGKPKPIEEFPKLKGNKRRKHCKQCFGMRISKGHQANKEPKTKPVTKARPVVKEVPAVEVKTVEEWVEKNLNKENNAVVKPSHYVGTNGLEVKQVLEEFVKDKAGIVAHRWCSAVEYLLRAYEKNGKEDLEKAKMNIEWLIEGAE